MQFTPLVSVIIPYYNNNATISETLKAIHRQTYKNIEVIIVDDGSTHKIPDNIKAEFSNLNVKYYESVNQGASAARNLGFKYSHGNYIQYLDADDLISEEKIERQIKLLRGRKNTISICKWGTFVNSINESDTYSHFLFKNWKSVDYVVQLKSKFSELMPIHSYLIPSELILQTEGWNEKITVGDDGEFMVRVLLKAEKICFEGNGMAYYRRSNPSSLSKLRTQNTYVSVLECCRSYRNEILRILSFEEAKYSIQMQYSLFYYFSYNYSKEIALEGLKDLRRLGIKEILPIGTKSLPLQRLIGPRNFLFIKEMLKKISKII